MANKRGLNVSRPPWLLALSLYIAALILNCMTPLVDGGRVVPSTNSVLSSRDRNYSQRPMDPLLQQRLLKGREVIPPMSPNAIPGEPSCQELRAMWRYYKRQSRAEYTNDIPRFGSNLFWDILPPPQNQHQQHQQQQQPQISSFAPIKGRSRARLKLKNNRNSLLPSYGRMTFKSERERQRIKEEQQPLRPMQQVAQMMGKGGGGNGRSGGGGPPPEAVVHYSPPPTQVPTTPSSLQQIRAILREEKLQEKSPAPMEPQQQSQSPVLPPQAPSDNGKTFGRIILGPPRGSDGRIANKAKEFMTPFEKIRFGHADDLLDSGFKPNGNLMSKRRSVPLHKFPARQTRTGPDGVSNSDGWMDGDGGGNGLELDKVEMGANVEVDYGTDDEEGGGWGTFSTGTDDMQINPQRMQQPQPSYERTFSNIPIQELPRSMDTPACPEVEGNACQSNSDCSCVGFGLYRCYINQCQILSFSPPGNPVQQETEGDVWHGGPVESDKLGVWESTSAEQNNANPSDNMNSNGNRFTRKAAAESSNSIQLSSATLNGKN